MTRVNGSDPIPRDDTVVVEEPMEIRISHGPVEDRSARSVSVTMRTPGRDFDLAAGFLFTEGLINGIEDVHAIEFCGPPVPGRDESNIVRVDLRPEVEVDTKKLQRNFFSTSSCGLCGKASLEALNFDGLPIPDANAPQFSRELVHDLPDRLRTAQALFDSTGGLHAAGLFDADGNPIEVCEDVGRHNAVDKVIGSQLRAGKAPLHHTIMVVSGRTSFEVMQKAIAAGIPAIIAVGAPSSLAIEVAQRFGMTLVGFARNNTFNVYAGAQRVVELV